MWWVLGVWLNEMVLLLSDLWVLELLKDDDPWLLVRLRRWRKTARETTATAAITAAMAAIISLEEEELGLEEWGTVREEMLAGKEAKEEGEGGEGGEG